MEIKDRFSEESLQIIKKYLQENNNKSMIFKELLMTMNLSKSHFFYHFIKRKILRKL